MYISNYLHKQIYRSFVACVGVVYRLGPSGGIGSPPRWRKEQHSPTVALSRLKLPGSTKTRNRKSADNYIDACPIVFIISV